MAFQNDVGAEKTTPRVSHSPSTTRACSKASSRNRGFSDRADDVKVAFAQSAAFVRFLRDRHGPAAFSELIDHVAAGDNFEKALGKAFHTSLSAEEQAFRDELPRRYPWWMSALSGGSEEQEE